MITPKTRVVRATDILVGEVDGELVIMKVNNGCYFNLDRIGADIWNRLETPCSLEELCAALEQAYKADGETIARDVRSFIEKMLANSLLRQVD
ncbi:PqqD family peptide modification chaperone [Ferrovibrio sp.]|uniref:PqqD family peptide modification chaperone n=1 Tax=Ferrovibrio sp. TaxID=1917215 RepID=UPI001B618E18|nr:PqqD family peptide modification chaperone [Ferrovibrio sp.]MBP7065783.1 PqqD family protein [Ferrovibrio sp.]